MPRKKAMRNVKRKRNIPNVGNLLKSCKVSQYYPRENLRY